MRLSLQFIILFIFSIFTINSFAWWDTGHMVIAEIAYQNLKPEVKNKVDNLVEVFRKEHPDVQTFPQMAAWPDALHSQQKILLYYHWHFIDIPLSGDGTHPHKNIIYSDNVAWAIRTITRSFSNHQAHIDEKARLLTFLIHTIGDIHQPLHTVSRVTAALPDGDEGGNIYPVFYNGQQINLHQLWDKGFGLYDDADKTPKHIREIANTITTLYPINYFGQRINNLNVENWLKEGMSNAQKFVYVTPVNQQPSAIYCENGKKLVAEQSALAGYRLANLLNQLFENRHKKVYK